MIKHEIPKGGGTCFICGEACTILHYYHVECKNKWLEEGGMKKPSDGKKWIVNIVAKVLIDMKAHIWYVDVVGRCIINENMWRLW